MPNPAHEVLFGLPECLEMVLEQLDPATLLVSAQRVCKTWHDSIAASPRLQRKLFFAPSDGRARDKKRTPNPLLVDAFPAFYNTGLPQENKIDPKHVLNRLGNTRDDCPKGDAPFLRKGASWRRMFPEYPVSFKVGFIDRIGMSELSFYSGVLDVPEGVTAGKLFDTAYTMAMGRKPAGRYFGVYWREKSQDPPINDYSWKCGMEETSLSEMAEDVKIVICSRYRGPAAPVKPGSVRAISTRSRPAEYEFSPVEVKLTHRQDWFG